MSVELVNEMLSTEVTARLLDEKASLRSVIPGVRVFSRGPWKGFSHQTDKYTQCTAK